MNNKTDINVQYVSPLKKICMTIGELPTSYLETMSYYEMLVWFTEFLKNQVIPTVNNNAEAVQELQSLYEELRTYVNDYFDNLDVQDEINNKLDAMAESGQLTDIIAQYLGLAGMIAFDTVADMKLAENLVNGSKCHTLGYRSVNDGGSALYKIRPITNDDVVDDMFIIEVYDNLLVAELIIDNELNVKQIGAYGNGDNDDTAIITNALSKVDNIYLPSGTYKLTNTLDVNSKNIRGDNYNTTIIDETGFTTPREHFIEFSGANNIKDLTIQKTFSGTGDYKLAKVCGLKGCYNSVFENVYFKSDGYSTGGTVDVYTDNHDVIFKDCLSYLYSKDSSNNNEEGGLWIREADSSKTSYNITLENCYLYSRSKDEIIGIWKWLGNLKNVFVNNCYLECPSTNTAPHFISIAGDNIQFNDCTMINETIQATGLTSKIGSIFHAVTGHSGNCIINNCQVTFNSETLNGLVANTQTGNIYVEDCIIKNGNFVTILGKGIYKNSEITGGIIQIDQSKCYNTILNYLNQNGNYKISQLGFELHNCELNGLLCNGTTFMQIFAETAEIIIHDTHFNGTFNPLYFIMITGERVISNLDIQNSNIGPIYDPAKITKGIINNCTTNTAIASLGAVTLNNIVVY